MGQILKLPAEGDPIKLDDTDQVWIKFPIFLHFRHSKSSWYKRSFSPLLNWCITIDCFSAPLILKYLQSLKDCFGLFWDALKQRTLCLFTHDTFDKIVSALERRLEHHAYNYCQCRTRRGEFLLCDFLIQLCAIWLPFQPRKGSSLIWKQNKRNNIILIRMNSQSSQDICRWKPCKIIPWVFVSFCVLRLSSMWFIQRKGIMVCLSVSIQWNSILVQELAYFMALTMVLSGIVALGEWNYYCLLVSLFR